MLCRWLLLLVRGLAAEQLVVGYLTGGQRQPGDAHYPRPGLTISGAISLAVHELNQDMLDPLGHHLSFIVAETYGDETTSIRQTAALWTQNVTAYIGPQETCVHEAKMAAAFNLPMISYFCTNYETSDKKEFPTFARTRPPDTQISKSVASVLLAFNWTQVTFFYLNSSDSGLGSVAATILSVLEGSGVKVSATRCWDSPYFHGYMENPFHKLVADTYQQTRIYVILGEHSEHVGLMVSMEQHNLFEKGEYWVVGVDIEQYDEADPGKYLRGLLQDEVDPMALRGFRSYLGVVPSPPKGFHNFTLQVNAYMEKPPFNFPNPVGYLGGVKLIRAEAAYLYDAVKLYAQSFLETLRENEDPTNGTAIINRLRQRHYHSAMGYMMYMDDNGDAEGNYTLLGMQMSPTGQYGLYPVGLFTYGSDSKLPDLHLTSTINWLNGMPPIAEPPCGFSGEKCITHTMEIAGGIAGAGLAIFILVALVLYRNWRYEQELDSLLWKVDYKEIQINDSDIYNQNSPGAKVTKVSHPLIRTSQVSLSSNPDADFRYSTIYTPVGIYRGRVLSIKKVAKKSIDITRAMKKKLKIMRDLRHDNLNAFIGACTDPPNICIITEYCTRGSLKDILENEDVKLDNMFIASLVGDILRGLIYLHDSALRFHGNLKASNCLVDSRWVVKLADFGFDEFKNGADTYHHHHHWSLKHFCDEQYKCGCEGLLYRAPELLRITTANPGVGSQKGDVYAFGVILYELHSRKGPFGDTTGLTTQQILQKVMYPPHHTLPFRPPLDLLENSFDFVRDCLKECWQENPDDRPDIKTIRTKLRPLRKGMKPNIFDNMIAMMEKYANNLEALVDERTDQLVEEKKKTEALLYEMLPRYVAEQLKRGLKVEAESFDSVTIYFSDIVGFTSMSAESTPLQVVDFLNDLYTCFDSTIENYDVYKVETIGDAYMVVSGLPVRNGDQHAVEIATMSLDTLDAVRKFKIRHRPHDKLKLRIGIHSGPVCAGVVGQKMPRYCLFGDTVNTASRMESTGEALKIHCSRTCKELLDKLQGYTFEERGLIDLKGKGEMMTYFLVGEEPAARVRRKIDRENRRAELRHGKRNKTENCPPRSSLKNRQTVQTAFSGGGLARCASFESPKRLRFATNHTVEFNQYQRTGLEAIADNSPGKRKQNGPLEPSDLAAEQLMSASCPCIENGHPDANPCPTPDRLQETNSDPAIFLPDQPNTPLLSQADETGI